MLRLYALSILLLLFPDNGDTAAIKCIYGQRSVCASDGFTYNNRCDFEIIQAIWPDVTIKHLGPCSDGGHEFSPFMKTYNTRKRYKNHMREHRESRVPKTKQAMDNFSKRWLKQIIRAQSRLGGILIGDTGHGNVFYINDYDSNDDSYNDYYNN